MVSGDISHLYGYVFETPEKKYELEIKFDEKFPNSPPELIYYNEIKNVLGKFELDTVKVWTPDSSVVEILNELKSKLQHALGIEEKEMISKAKDYVTEKVVQGEQISEKESHFYK